MSTTRLSWEDILIVILYFIAVIAVGIYASCRASRNTVSGYFLAGRTMMFFTVGASLFVSNIGSEHFIGLAGSGAAGGIGVGAWEFNAILLIQLLGFVFVPVYIACKTYTMPEYMNLRFGGQRIRIYLAVLSLFLYIFTKCSVNLYTGALFIQQSLGWDLYLSILLQITIVAILTITGGLTAVIYTDTLQAVLMIAGALSLMAKGFYDIGGFNELWRRYPLAVTNLTVPNTTCHEVNPNWNVMLRGPSDPEMPWLGFLLGQTPASIWYWCADQVIVQRVLAAKNLSHAQGSTILAGFAKILPLFMMVMPGMIARVLYTDEVACVDPEVCWKTCQSRTACTNVAYPKLVLGIMPKGARGIMLAVMLAALMSDLDSIFNSASTMFTIDIYHTIRKKAGVRELMVVGRLFIVVMVAVAIAWVPIVKETQGGQLFIYIQEVSAYLAPPIACIYLLAILWPRCNEQGAFWGLMAGFVTGVIRLILIFVYPGPEKCGDEDTRPDFLTQFHYMYYAVLIFWITGIVAFVISMVTNPPSYRQIYRTTFWTRFHKMSKNDLEDGVKVAWEKLPCCFNVTLPKECQTEEYDNPSLEMEEDCRTEAQPVSTILENNLQSSPNISEGMENIQMEENENGSTPQSGTTENTQDCGNITTSDVITIKRKRYWKDILFSWFCGVTGESFGGNQQTKEEQDREDAEEEKICSLEQEPRDKCVLYIFLIIIICVGVFLFCFFSLWRYTVT